MGIRGDGWRTMRSWHLGTGAALADPPSSASPTAMAPPTAYGPPAPTASVIPDRWRRATMAALAPAAPAPERMQWTLTLIGFLGYMFTVVTFKLPIATAAMVVALAGLVMQRERLRLPAPVIWFGMFVAWSAVGYSQTNYPSVVWDVLLQFVKVWLIALVAVNALRTRMQLRVFMVFYLACFALFPVRGALVNYSIDNTMFGRISWNFIYSNPNDLAALSLLQLSLAVGILMTDKAKWVKLCALIGCLVLPIVILITQSRGTILGLALFAGFSWVGQRRRLRGLLVLGLIGAGAAMAAPSSVWERMRGLRNATSAESLRDVDPEGSARQRWEIWRIAGTILRDRPVVGTGLGAYNVTHHDYALRPAFDPIGRGYRDAHSTYLRVAAENGIVGLGIFLALIASVLVFADRVRRACRERLRTNAMQLFYLELGMAAFLVNGLFGSFAHLSYTFIQLMLIWAVADASRRELAALETSAPAAVHGGVAHAVQ